MNTETQKQIVLKTVLVAGLACLAWMFIVKPEQQNTRDQHQTVASYQTLIAAYQDQVGTSDSNESLVIKERLEEVAGMLLSTDTQSDSGTALHNLINESASKNGVSMSKIESVNSRKLSQRIEGMDNEIIGVNHIVRIEFEGEYDSVMVFMNEVISGATQVKFVSFRFVPVGFNAIKANAEISSVILTSILSNAELEGAINE